MAALAPLLRRILIALVLAELGVIQLQLAWLLWHARGRERLAARGKRFAAEIGGWLDDVLGNATLRPRWIRRARGYPRAVVRAHLEPLLGVVQGQTRAALRDLYGAVGLLAEDAALLRSWRWSRRLLGVRRLSLVATAAEAPLLLARRADRHVIRVLAARILVRVGSPEQLLAFLQAMKMPRRLMEAPLAEALAGASPQQMELLLARLESLVDRRIRRLVLVSAARIAPRSCLPLLLDPGRTLDKEGRITWCLAAGQLAAPELVPSVIAALSDPAPEVRAQAAWACGQMPGPATLEALTRALVDTVFWVRQNAAQALMNQGDAGGKRLEEVAARGTDRFAADTARQELQRRELVWERAS